MKRRKAIGVAGLLAVLSVTSGAASAQECSPDARVPHASTTVVYRNIGGATQATIISPGDDGTVYAVDLSTHGSLWAFTPPEVIASSVRNGLLTDLRILRFDANDDGTIDSTAGDRVWLYFGLRSAGAAYYALDITERDRPRVLWKADAMSLEGLGDAWSTPTIARVRIAGARQNGEHFVLIFGGGYTKDAPTANRIFMVDAATGHLLWNAGASGEQKPDLVLADMTDPVPASLSVLDTDGDEFADRMYAIDVSGHLWRFDIWNGRARDTLVSGGVLADLGDPKLPSAGARMFFNAPDVALIRPKGAAPYYSVSVGSGDVTSGVPGSRSSPASSPSDRFYSVRDREPFDARSQSTYDSATPILASDLADISASLDSTALPPDAAGWFIDVSTFGRSGESIIAESITLNGVVMFTTFQRSATASPCDVSGSTRVYAVRVDDGRVGADLNGDGKITNADISLALPDTAAPAAIRVRLGEGRSDDSAPTNGTGGPRPGPAGGTPATPLLPECLVGSTVLETCVVVDALVRTYWQRPGVR